MSALDLTDPQTRRKVARRLARPRRLLLVVAIGGTFLVASAAGVAIASAGSMRARFEQGRLHLERAQTALIAGDFRRAELNFGAAAVAFDSAAAGPSGWVLQVTGWVPYLGRTPRALRALAAIGEGVSGAGAAVSARLARLPAGLSAIGPQNGTIPIGTIQALAPAVHRARRAVDAARASATRLPASWVFGPVRPALDIVQARLAEAAPLARAADALADALPAFAGRDGPRRYFVAVQNTAELRGTGGLIGNYAILTLDGGAVSLSPFSDIGRLRNVAANALAPPTADYGRRYDAFGGPGFWLNLNMTPDTPTAARAIEALYQRVTGDRLDGVVFFDLQGLADLLRATGPVSVPELGETFSSSNVVQAVAASTYLRARVTDPFTQGPRLIAEATWSRFLTRARPEESLRVLVDAAASGDLKLYANDRPIEAAFRQAGVGGLYRSAPGDQFGVVMSNAAANKVDASLLVRVSYDVRLRQGGVGTAVASASITNGIPAGRAASYSLGPSGAARAAGLDLMPGEGRWWTSFYCATDCTVVRSRSAGRSFPFEAGRENGLSVYSNFLDAEPQQTAAATMAFVSRHIWAGGEASGSYRLVVRTQPTVRPTEVTVTIHAPAGMGISWTSRSMRVDGAVATWSGAAGAREVFAVRFQRSFLGRLGGRIWQLLDRPVAKL